MSTLVLWSALGLVLIWLATKLPGIREMAQPVLAAGGHFIIGIIKWGGAYVLFFVKTILYAHVDLVRHLSNPRRSFDPAEDARKSRDE